MTIGEVKDKTPEYFEGEVVHKGQVVSKVYGNYCGYMDFDGKRYWDFREMDTFWKEYGPIPEKDMLASDSTFRADL